MKDNIEACRKALSRYDLDDNARTVQQKSRDFYWYSPILKELLDAVCGDFVVAPRNEAEIVDILATCHRHDVPVTVRGAGTGNYGQAMPLAGGAVLHMKHMKNVIAVADDHLIAEPGAVLARVEEAAREKGREIRLFPSTVATATIGGFIAGGSSGIGAVRWGGLRNPANIRRLRLVTMEAEPRILELTGDNIAKAAHAYGVNGVITEVEIPIDPAGDWVDVLIGAEDFNAANRLAFLLGDHPQIALRMLSTFQAPIPERYFGRYQHFTRPGDAAIALIVARDCLPALEEIVAGSGNAAIRFPGDGHAKGQRLPPIHEIAWNHTTLRALKVDDDITYLQMLLPQDDLEGSLRRIEETFGEDLLMHFEFTRFAGRLSAVAMPLLRYQSTEHIELIVETLENGLGLTVFNPHRVTLEEGGMKRTDEAQLQFKRENDPKGLLNPGKMIAFTDPDWRWEKDRIFLFNSEKK